MSKGRSIRTDISVGGGNQNLGVRECLKLNFQKFPQGFPGGSLKFEVFERRHNPSLPKFDPKSGTEITPNQ